VLVFCTLQNKGLICKVGIIEDFDATKVIVCSENQKTASKEAADGGSKLVRDTSLSSNSTIAPCRSKRQSLRHYKTDITRLTLDKDYIIGYNFVIMGNPEEGVSQADNRNVVSGKEVHTGGHYGSETLEVDKTASDINYDTVSKELLDTVKFGKPEGNGPKIQATETDLDYTDPDYYSVPKPGEPVSAGTNTPELFTNTSEVITKNFATTDKNESSLLTKGQALLQRALEWFLNDRGIPDPNNSKIRIVTLHARARGSGGGGGRGHGGGPGPLSNINRWLNNARAKMGWGPFEIFADLIHILTQSMEKVLEHAERAWAR